MKHDQEYTPKYWIAHNPKESDVHLNTASKSFNGALQKYQKDFDISEKEYFANEFEGLVSVDLFELKRIKNE